jgi:hypothetical protein
MMRVTHNLPQTKYLPFVSYYISLTNHFATYHNALGLLEKNHHLGEDENYRSKRFELNKKSQLHNIITNDSGNPDYLAINIYYDTLRSWYAPNKLKKEDGGIINISKLKTKGIYSSYKKLSELHGCSTETIRRKLVKLEKLGLIQRSFKHKETVTTKSYNQLIIYVWRHTPHFFNKHGIDQAEVGALKPQTNHEYITEKYNIDYYSQIEQIKAIESRGGIHKLVDTKELIEPFNKLKDRSNESNFCKNNFNFKNTNTESDIKTEGLIAGGVSNTAGTSIVTNSVSSNGAKPQDSSVSSIASKNGFLGGGKNLKDLLEHLTDEMCSTLRSKCGKDYTDRAIREIAKAVSRSKKGAKAFFFHIKGFIAYLTKILTFEKRDSVKINDTNYYITVNQTNEEREIRKQEKYLTDVEYSLQVSPEWHLKKKLASVLERNKAYNLLIAYKSLDIKGNSAVVHLRKHVELSSMDKDIIMQQIQAAHEKIDDQGNYLLIESLELEMPDKNTPHVASFSVGQSYPKREGVWGKIRETFASYLGSEGDHLDEAWLSKFSTKINEEKQTIELQAPTEFVRDWVVSNYQRYIEDASMVNGLRVVGIKISNKVITRNK